MKGGTVRDFFPNIHYIAKSIGSPPVRIEKGPVQTVAIKLEAHNSLEYHYMLKH